MEAGARCRRCGRPLRDPASVAVGLGPICQLRELALLSALAGEEEADTPEAPGEPGPPARRPPRSGSAPGRTASTTGAWRGPGRSA